MVSAFQSETDERIVPFGVRLFIQNRLFEFVGLIISLLALGLGLAIATWDPADLNYDSNSITMVSNWLGPFGSYLADIVVRSFGLSGLLLVIIPMTWAFSFLNHRSPKKIIRKFIYLILAVVVGSIFLALVFQNSFDTTTKLSGAVGSTIISSILFSWMMSFNSFGLIAVFVSLSLMVFLAFKATGINFSISYFIFRLIGERVSNFSDLILGRLFHFVLSLKYFLVRFGGAALSNNYFLFSQNKNIRAGLGNKIGADITHIEPRFNALSEAGIETHSADDDPLDDEDSQFSERFSIVSRSKKAVKQSKRAKTEEAPTLFDDGNNFALPSLRLLSEPKHAGRGVELSDDALEANARLLEGVLEDFGVRGDITKVHPGPVVTLYELEPAPGIKSSRVIGLADDIARSMSALSARVAVIPGKNAIGIELPNQTRETVFLRELLASADFDRSNCSLNLALGKNIGGEPIFADLARMPHLLIAGTTGSGKSVGINAMILSILYRMSPDACRLIMIDPKMLELSVYEGIPHLLAPVVTDPKKAVVALKWAVREMEDRYQKMSKLGVRNIDGYNTRVKQALAKGEGVSRTVQTGYDPNTGSPLFESEPISLGPMPFIVVIIDEMADLMMVAGKDIEGAVQRLAQMARAAGIHVIMATQRPSVDVITGTIKANFPTRVSFQVTSKIDSRTILGEQGAEQLLGQGDMLYMAGGGRISRLHAPFVSDDEVENIVAHLKAQGNPNYLDSVTEDDDEEFGNGADQTGDSGDALYDQAVAVILRDKKVSTSYIQRRLQVGYNKAASLIERMESEGLISQANSSGKREILVNHD